MLFLDYSPDLNDIEMDTYRYVSQNMNKVIYMTIRELAAEVHVSNTVIWRFCKKFDCEGYSDFRYHLREYVHSLEKFQVYDQLDSSEIIDFINRTNGPLISERLAEAAKILSEKDIIIFLGEGTSKLVAEYGEVFFSSAINLSLSISHPLLYPDLRKISTETSEKVGVVVLSVSGETEKIIRNVEKFVESGINCISITNTDRNTVSKLTDINIPYFINGEKNETADITSQVPALYLIEKLAHTILKSRETNQNTNVSADAENNNNKK